jgi:4-amino-4-deoxy-L-arabinose transferase-like glycosyltransferase
MVRDVEKKSPRLRYVLALAFAIRIAFLIHVARAGFVTGEGRVLADISTNLLSGRGYSLSREMLYPSEPATAHQEMREAGFELYRRVDGFYGVLRPGRETTFLMPGYILFMSGIFSLAGIGNLMAVRAVQLMAAGMLSVMLGISIARRFLSGWPLLLAALFMAVDPFEIYFEAIPATQALFSLALLASLLASIRALERPGPARAALAGAAWGLTFLIRPVAVSGAVVFAACLLLSGRSLWRKLLLALLAMGAAALILLPWAVRMKNLTGQWRVFPTQGGVNLWEFNGRLFSDQLVDEQESITVMYGPLRAAMEGRLALPDLAEFPDFVDESEATRDSVLTARTARFLLANPELLVRLPLLRFADFVKPFSFNQMSLPYVISGVLTWGLATLLAGGGAIVLLRRRSLPAFLLVCFVGVYAAGHIATVAGIPHRVAIDFPIAIFAAAALGEMADRIRSGGCRARASA